MPYRIKNEYLKSAALVTTIGDESVNLKGQDLKRIVAATQKTVEKTVLIRAATQNDLESAFKAGNPCIEFYAEKSKTIE